MQIVGFSINPLFPDRVIGGSAKHQKNVLVHLGELGHRVTVLCTRHPDSQRPFHWHEHVEVRPVLPFKQPFPQPYETPAYALATVIETVAEALESADRFYMHDGELLIPYLYRHIPTVISLRDNVYPETILGSFLFEGDALIAIAEYSRQVYLSTAGRFIPELAERAVTIHNGLDFVRFAPGPPSRAMCELTGVDPDRDCIVLHPHRPETTKGLPQTIAVADRMVHQYGVANLKVLVPRWFDAAISAEVRAYYDAVQQEIAARGLQDHFIFHDWIPQSLMPDYYRLGHLTLVLGSFVEAFGNVPYESLACGTPAIAARVATHRSLLPDHLIDKVHFDDHATAAALAADVWRERRRTSAETLAYLRTHFDIQTQLDGYAQAILGARKLPPVRRRTGAPPAAPRYRLSPWCYTWGDGQVYHDYHARHVHRPALAQLCDAHPDGFGVAEAAEAGLSAEQLADWRRDGYLTPIV